MGRGGEATNTSRRGATSRSGSTLRQSREGVRLFIPRPLLSWDGGNESRRAVMNATVNAHVLGRNPWTGRMLCNELKVSNDEKPVESCCSYCNTRKVGKDSCFLLKLC